MTWGTRVLLRGDHRKRGWSWQQDGSFAVAGRRAETSGIAQPEVVMAEPVVQTSYGKLAGREEEGLLVFRGVPFAQAPLGPLRFRAPEPPAPWPGVRDAGEFGPAAIQPPDLIGPAVGIERPGRTSEDCLWLNVWTPGADGARRPVLVWIHGGAFTIGAGSQPICDGAALARRGDVVVVTVNYRLGALGFLALGEAGDGAPASTGNEGLLDQVAALAWVRDEIAGFGGDPANVTVFGESAGSMSVSCLLAMPRARGLFRRAILQSGAPNLIDGGGNRAPVARAFLEALGTRAEQVAALGDVATRPLLAAQVRVSLGLGRAHGGVVFRPSVDGDVLPRHPFDAVAAGSAAGIDVLIGTTLDEMKLFGLLDPDAMTLDDAKLLRRCAYNIPGDAADGTSHAARAVETYRALRAARGAPTTPPDLWFAIESDRVFRVPSMRLAELQQRNYAGVYAYLFTWPSPFRDGILGACHALDIPFVFGTHTLPTLRPLAGSGPDADAVAARVQDAWIAFARSGRPGHAGIGEWPAYEPARRRTMLLGAECAVVDAPYEAERRFWETVG
jgi:para-nitrobenzyl esterase